MDIPITRGLAYTKTNPHTSRPDSGGELTDGLLGTTELLDAEWVGWQNMDVTIVIDLVRAEPLAGVRFHYLVRTAYSIYAPLQLVVSGSNDNTSYTTLGTFAVDADWLSAGTAARWSNDLAVAGTYRYVRFVFTAHDYAGSWLYLSEVEVLKAISERFIYDRSATDVTGKTAKAFLNLEDWARIYNWSKQINAYATLYLGRAIQFNAVRDMSITSIPRISDLNTMLANIERIRSAMGLSKNYGGTAYIRSNWDGGSKITYSDVNNWEKVLSTIFDSMVQRKPRTGVAICGAGILRNNGFRS